MASLYSTYTTKELRKKVKKQKIMAMVQTIVIVLMLIFGVFSWINKGISFYTFMPLFFIPMLFVMSFELKKLKKELAQRTK
ncbi:hypothetical protein JL193_10615 [Polaribacter batillariae]|uniref:Redox-active disulfide protein 2 n=1 Tax=Polaribacter batillariae TaxID=2808900 RepID=A0ABX7SQT4_9FLAO|nr:hypothetical protein [Polaribacter batillariae]QTD36595.1 hypothetical protein JL193_10615 [Polaribacter batillariae]